MGTKIHILLDNPISKSTEYNKTIDMYFTDNKKAFDTVQRIKLLKELENIQLDHKDMKQTSGSQS